MNFKERLEKSETDNKQIEKLNKLTNLQLKDKINSKNRISKLLSLKKKADKIIDKLII